MDELNHSTDAENVLNLFYQVDYIVYVEGQDDICFWEKILTETTDLKFEVQDVGGSTQLVSYIDSIINNNLNIIVACDSDLTIFEKNRKNHSRILRTYGYAIENTYIDSRSIISIIKSLAKIKSQQAEGLKVVDWLKELDNRTQELVELDIFNKINNCGVSVVGDNATRFMKNSASSDLCAIKIGNFTSQIRSNFVGYDSNKVKREISSRRLKHFLLLRGHFIFSAAAKFISVQSSKFGKKISVSNESLYSNFMSNFDNNFNSAHPEYEYYHSITNRI